MISDSPLSGDWAERYLDVMNDLVILVGAFTGTIVEVNPAAVRRLQPAGHDLVDSYVMNLVHPDDRQLVAEALAEIQETTEFHLNLRLNRADQTRHETFDVYLRFLPDTEQILVMCRDSTELFTNRDRLAHLQHLVELTSDILLVTDLAGTVVETNPAACRVHGKTMEELVGKPVTDFIHPDGLEMWDRIPNLIMEGKGRSRYRMPGLRADGSRIEFDCVTIVDFERDLAYTVERDVSDEVARERQLEVAQRFFTLTSDLLAMLDEDHRIVRVNRSFERFVGREAEEVTGLPLADVLGCIDESLTLSLETIHRQTLETRITVASEADNRSRMLSIGLHRHARTNHTYIAARDVTDEYLLTNELRHQAETDRLTGLANRSAFFKRLQTELSEDRPVALAFLDLDNFKTVNDSLGHAAGDSMLHIVAERLQRCVRSDDLVARFGGDEFCIMLTDVERSAQIEMIAGMIRDAVNEPMTVDNRLLVTSCSLGLIVSEPGTTAEELMKHADAAAYRAKEVGRNCYVVFDDELNVRMSERFELEAELRKAIDNQELDVDVQGVFDAAEQVVGVEALVRWNHPTRGRLAPAEFLAIAEQAGLMGPLGDRVVERSFEALSPWLRTNGRAAVSINLSPAQLADSGLPARLSMALHRHEVDPHQVIVEISEESLLVSPTRTASTLREIHDLGFRLALDDFGKGPSGLGHLRDLPFAIVKIDREVTCNIKNDPVNASIVESVIGLANHLNLIVVAEGVENADHAQALTDLGCNRLQGFHLHRPEPVVGAEILKMLFPVTTSSQ